MMRALEMDHSIDKAAALMKEIDTDGSGAAPAPLARFRKKDTETFSSERS